LVGVLLLCVFRLGCNADFVKRMTAFRFTPPSWIPTTREAFSHLSSVESRGGGGDVQQYFKSLYVRRGAGVGIIDVRVTSWAVREPSGRPIAIGALLVPASEVRPLSSAAPIPPVDPALLTRDALLPDDIEADGLSFVATPPTAASQAASPSVGDDDGDEADETAVRLAANRLAANTGLSVQLIGRAVRHAAPLPVAAAAAPSPAPVPMDLTSTR
jgi:hypothetical protein